MADRRARTIDPFLLNYQPSELRIASEFLSTWLPFLSRDLCHRCVQILSHRIRSLDPFEPDGDVGRVISVPTTNNTESHEWNYNNDDNCDSHSLGSWKDGDGTDMNSLGSWNWKDGADKYSGYPADISASETACESSASATPGPRMSWADMAQEDELEEEEEREANKLLVNGHSPIVEVGVSNVRQKTELSREQREYIRFMNVKRKKDFICLERVKGKPVNILDGLELHTGIFSAVEQKRIVDYVFDLQEMGKNGQLKERTYTAPQKWMRGKGRETIQFGCCYNYATDKNGNPPGILLNESVDPLPHLFKVIIRRLVNWHVLPPSCVPDSCIVNIYEEGDCIPPHIDNHDFVRPFCTVSFLSECDILFGSNLKVVGAGEFSGSTAIPLPVGSVLVLNGNGADVAKHCVPAVHTKRISITFRKMDEAKRPVSYVPEPDLQGLQPLSYEVDKSKRSTPAKKQRPMYRPVVREGNVEARRSAERGGVHSEPRYVSRTQQWPGDRRRLRVSLGS